MLRSKKNVFNFYNFWNFAYIDEHTLLLREILHKVPYNDIHRHTHTLHIESELKTVKIYWIINFLRESIEINTEHKMK